MRHTKKTRSLALELGRSTSPEVPSSRSPAEVRIILPFSALEKGYAELFSDVAKLMAQSGLL